MYFFLIARRHRLLCLLCLALLPGGCVPLSLTESGISKPAAGQGGMQSEVVAAYLRHRAQSSSEELSYRPWIGLLPFEDDSGFRAGVWDVVNEVPRMLSGEMERSTAWRVIPYEVVSEIVGSGKPRWTDDELQRIGADLRADILLTGVLLDYNLERLHVGDPLIGGYKSYKGVAEIEVLLYRVADLTRIGNAHAQQETIDRGLGFDLLGKPREQDHQFANLGEMAYGEQEFRGTAIGQATVMAMDEILQKAAKLVRPKGIQVLSGAPEILSVFGSEIFINVGSENGVHEGYRFGVYPATDRADVDRDQRIAVIEVRDIIGARVSRVTALFGGGQIGIGDRLELIGAEPESE